MQNDVWEVVPRLEGKSVVTSRWLYKVKFAVDGNVEKYKARFVARGFSQIEGVDYGETFAPVARYTSIRSIIALAVEMGWRIHQMDVKTAFLHGEIEEEIYIEQPQGFETRYAETHVPPQEGVVWSEASSQSLVFEDRYLLAAVGIQEE